MSWAEEEAAKIARREQKQADERRWHLHCDEVAKRDGPAFFRALCDQIEKYVAEFNATLGSKEIAIERAPRRISVTKESYKSVHFRLDLTDAGVDVFERRVLRESDAENRARSMKFTVSNGDTLHLDGFNHETVATQILKPVFEVFG